MKMQSWTDEVVTCSTFQHYGRLERYKEMYLAAMENKDAMLQTPKSWAILSSDTQGYLTRAIFWNGESSWKKKNDISI